MDESSAAAFNVYIDESGDEGFKPGSTDWFVVAAVIVRREDDLAVSACVDKMKAAFGVAADRPLHWVKRRNHSDRRFMVRELAGQPIWVSAVAMNKRGLQRSDKLQQPPALYLYATRFLLERVTGWIDLQGGTCEVTFEHRASLSVETIREYITYISQQSERPLKLEVARHITSEAKAQRKMLQIADIVSGCVYAALQKDRLGLTEPSYLLALGNKLISNSYGRVHGWGLKLFPDNPFWLAEEDGESYGWLMRL